MSEDKHKEEDDLERFVRATSIMMRKLLQKQKTYLKDRYDEGEHKVAAEQFLKDADNAVFSVARAAYHKSKFRLKTFHESKASQRKALRLSEEDPKFREIAEELGFVDTNAPED